MFYLNVPYTAKNLVKKLGARWDINKKKWFVPEGLDRGVFRKWMPHNEAFERALNLGPEWGGKIDQLGGACAINKYGLHPDQMKRALTHYDWMIRASAVQLGGLSPVEMENALTDLNHQVRSAALSLDILLTPMQLERALLDCENQNRQQAVSKGGLTSRQIARALKDDDPIVRLILVESGCLNTLEKAIALTDIDSYVRAQWFSQ